MSNDEKLVINSALTRIKIHNTQINLATREVTREGYTCRLEPRVMTVLRALIFAEGQAVSREHLMDEIWGHEDGSDESLTQAISKLRRAIGDDTNSIIKTIPKFGYHLTTLVEPNTHKDRFETTRPAQAITLNLNQTSFHIIGIWMVLILFITFYFSSVFNNAPPQKEIVLELEYSTSAP